MKTQICLLLMLMVLLGCDSGSGTSVSKPVDVGGSTADAPGMVTSKVMDYAGIQMLIESYRGKVVVVDYWSTSCPPCLRELPGLVALQKEFSSDKVKCITVSLDYLGLPDEGPETYTSQVMPVLTKIGATCDNIIAADDSEKMLKKLELSAPPAVYVFGTDGKLVKRFDNEEATGEADEFTYKKDVQPLVAKLVKAEAG